MPVKISFDPAKRASTLDKRGLDFVDAALVFAGNSKTARDERRDYPEVRFVTTGLLRSRLVVIVWTPTATGRRIISMRKANDREQARDRRGGN